MSFPGHRETKALCSFLYADSSLKRLGFCAYVGGPIKAVKFQDGTRVWRRGVMCIWWKVLETKYWKQNHLDGVRTGYGAE